MQIRTNHWLYSELETLKPSINLAYVFSVLTPYYDGLVQERHNSIANALELRLSCTNPSNWGVL